MIKRSTLIGTVTLTIATLLIGGPAASQENDWKEWASARYYWDLDREEMDNERERNTSIRGELGLRARAAQAPEASLTPPPGGSAQDPGAAAGFAPEPTGPVVTDSPRTAVRPPDPPPSPRLSAAERRRQKAEERRRRAEETRASRAEASRLRREEKAQADRDRREETRQRAEETRIQADEERRRRVEADRRKTEEARLRAEDERRRGLEEAKKKKDKEIAERKKKIEEERRLKALDKKLLEEKTNDRGQVVDDELDSLLDEELE